MLRAELDALPIKEQTGLPYMSTEYMADMWGQEHDVMHACGHDMHMACLIAAAKLLSDARSEWSGTLEVLFQPNEEHTGGAEAMVNDGIYERIPIPHVVMAQHLLQIPSGTVSVRGGPVLVSADTVKVRIFSTMGHAANPQVAVDVGIVASKIIVRLHDSVQQVSKGGYAAISVQEIHAGAPGLDWVEYLDMVLDVKAYDPAIRNRLLELTTAIIEDEVAASGAVQRPLITSSIRAPATVNDEEIAEHVRASFVRFFGRDNVLQDLPSHPCEDFSILAAAANASYLFWFLGRTDPISFHSVAQEKDKLLDKIPIEHSPFNAPIMHPTMETGMNALSLAALSFLRGGASSRV